MSLFDKWLAELEARHLADLRFNEVTKALRALSATYVEKRGRLDEGAALTGAGKRAAFALFYGPLHFLTVHEVAKGLQIASLDGKSLGDLGCGTGAAGAAWAVASPKPEFMFGIDRNPWAVTQADRTYRQFELIGSARQGDIGSAPFPERPSAFLAAFAVNELTDAARDRLLTRLQERAGRGDALLVVEPIARSIAPWWARWTQAVERLGGRADEWRFRVELPEIVAKLDRAAGLDHRELTARSLWLPGAPRARREAGPAASS